MFPPETMQTTRPDPAWPPSAAARASAPAPSATTWPRVARMRIAAALGGYAGSGRVVCIVSGGNIDADRLAAILSGAVPEG